MSKRRVLPEGLDEAIISKTYLSELERHSNTLITEIKSFLLEAIDTDVRDASVEVFPDEYGDGYTSVGFYFRGKSIRHVTFAEYVNDLPAIDVMSYQENDVFVPDIVVDLVKRWFAECWFKAGGWDYPLAVELKGHDCYGDGEVIVLTRKS